MSLKKGSKVKVKPRACAISGALPDRTYTVAERRPRVPYPFLLDHESIEDGQPLLGPFAQTDLIEVAPR